MPLSFICFRKKYVSVKLCSTTAPRRTNRWISNKRKHITGLISHAFEAEREKKIVNIASRSQGKRRQPTTKKGSTQSSREWIESDKTMVKNDNNCLTRWRGENCTRKKIAHDDNENTKYGFGCEPVKKGAAKNKAQEQIFCSTWLTYSFV